MLTSNEKKHMIWPCIQQLHASRTLNLVWNDKCTHKVNDCKCKWTLMGAIRIRYTPRLCLVGRERSHAEHWLHYMLNYYYLYLINMQTGKKVRFRRWFGACVSQCAYLELMNKAPTYAIRLVRDSKTTTITSVHAWTTFRLSIDDASEWNGRRSVSTARAQSVGHTLNSLKTFLFDKYGNPTHVCILNWLKFVFLSLLFIVH